MRPGQHQRSCQAIILRLAALLSAEVAKKISGSLASNLDESTLPDRHQFRDDRMALLHRLDCDAASLGHCAGGSKGSLGKPPAEDWASISQPPKTTDLSRPCSSPFMTDDQMCLDFRNLQAKDVVHAQPSFRTALFVEF